MKNYGKKEKMARPHSKDHYIGVVLPDMERD